MRSHDHRLALAVAILLALTLLPAATVPSRAILAGDVPPVPSPAPTPTATPAPEPDPEPDAHGKPDLEAYRGLASWIDMYDNTYDHPTVTVETMKANGVRTIFVETGNFHRPHDWRRDIYRERKVERVIHAAHARGMQVVAWYLPSFANPRRDFRRSMAAINFRTSKGQRFDSFSLDIEYHGVSDLRVRNQRLRLLSRRLDAAVPDDYAMGAIVPEAHALYWRNFPYKLVARHFDVFLPMAYYTFRTSGRRGVHRWISNNIYEIRKETGDWNMPVHAIGGLTVDSEVEEVRAFVDAAISKHAIGASLYSFPGMKRAQWAALQRVN